MKKPLKTILIVAGVGALAWLGYKYYQYQSSGGATSATPTFMAYLFDFQG